MTDVLMPQMGESIVEGTVTKWLKKVGDKVERDEPLLEISTDKVDSEVPAPVAGTVEEMLVPEGETVEINTVVARIGDGSGAGQAQQQEAATNGEESHASTASASTAVTAAETVPEPSTPPATPEPTPAPADDGDSVSLLAFGAPARQRARHRPAAGQGHGSRWAYFEERRRSVSRSAQSGGCR